MRNGTAPDLSGRDSLRGIKVGGDSQFISSSHSLIHVQILNRRADRAIPLAFWGYFRHLS